MLNEYTKIHTIGRNRKMKTMTPQTVSAILAPSSFAFGVVAVLMRLPPPAARFDAVPAERCAAGARGSRRPPTHRG